MNNNFSLQFTCVQSFGLVWISIKEIFQNKKLGSFRTGKKESMDRLFRLMANSIILHFQEEDKLKLRNIK